MTDTMPPVLDDSAPFESWQPEPELSRWPPPRRIAPTLRTHFFRLMRVLLAIGLPVGMAVVGYFTQHALDRLAEHGKITTAKVVESRPATKSQSAEVVVEYHVDGRPFRLTAEREEFSWPHSELGGEPPIRYLPDRPEAARSEHGFQTAMGKPKLAHFLWIFSAVLFCLLLPAFVYVEFWWLGRIRRVMRYGVPTAGRIISLEKHGPGKHDVWRSRYQFAGSLGAMVEATSYVHTDDLEAIKRSQFLTILVDPVDDRKSELYLGTLRYYRIVPETSAG
jgi:hypothetical protein